MPIAPRASASTEGGDAEVRLRTHFESVGAQMAQDVVAMTSDAVGDGTATALVIMRQMFLAGSELIHAGNDPASVKRGIDRAVETVVSELALLSAPVATRTQIVQVGRLSADGDELIGNLIADAMVPGTAGVVTLRGHGSETSLELGAGMRFQGGYLSHYFVTDSERREAVLHDAYVLIHAGELTDVRTLSALLEQVAKTGRPLLVVAEIDSTALTTLVSNKVKGTLDVCVVNPPGGDERRLELLRDLEVMSGGRAISVADAPEIGAWTLEHLGQARIVVVTRSTTILIRGAGHECDIAAHVGQLRVLLDTLGSVEERTRLEERLARLAGDVAVLHVGAEAEGQLNERRRRIETALHATRAALEEGIVAGGGVALVRTLPALEKLALPAAEQCGVEVVGRAIEQPLRQMVENGGLSATAVLDEVRAGQGAFGYNALSCEYEDLVQAGIVDATKVLRVALQTAASVATSMLTAEHLIPEPAGVSSVGKVRS